jgi:hypothetical protein
MEWHGHHSGQGIGTGNSEAWRFVLFFGDSVVFRRIEWETCCRVFRRIRVWNGKSSS